MVRNACLYLEFVSVTYDSFKNVCELFHLESSLGELNKKHKIVTYLVNLVKMSAVGT